MRNGIVGALLAFLLLACAGLSSRLETPVVSFVGIKALEAKLFEQRLELRLLVRNPNDLDLPVRGLDIDVELAGEHFAHGVSAREAVPYRLKGKLSTRLGILRSIPFEETGTLPLDNLTGKRRKTD